MNTTHELTIDDGKETYIIKNLEGEELGSFRLNPSDLNFRNRYESVVEALSNMKDMFSEEEDGNSVLDKLETKIMEQIDFLFGSNVSKDFFKIASPFSPMADGEFFFEKVIDCIGRVIESDSKLRMDKINKKIKKHAGKYHG